MTKSNVSSKSLVVLGGAVVVVIVAVVVLAQVVAPEEPTFSEGFEEATESPEGSLDFVPTAVGGELEVSGDREGTISLRQGTGDRFELISDDARLFLESNPLALDQMSYDGLEFFPDPDACEFTEGEHNEDRAIAAVRVECPELVDIRGNGSISLQGYVAVPADRIVEIDVPDPGGTVRFGDNEWEVHDPQLILGQTENAGNEENPVGLTLTSLEENTPPLFFAYDEDSETLSLARIFNYGGEFGEEDEIDVDPEACSVTTEELVVASPQVEYHAMDFSCESVDLDDDRQVQIEGSVVFKKYLEPIPP